MTRQGAEWLHNKGQELLIAKPESAFVTCLFEIQLGDETPGGQNTLLFCFPVVTHNIVMHCSCLQLPVLCGSTAGLHRAGVQRRLVAQ